MKLLTRFLLYVCVLLLTTTQYLCFRNRHTVFQESQHDMQSVEADMLVLQGKHLTMIKSSPLGKKKKRFKATISAAENSEEDEDEDDPGKRATFKKYIKTVGSSAVFFSVNSSSLADDSNNPTCFVHKQYPQPLTCKYLLYRVIRI